MTEMCHRWFSSYCLIEENMNLGYTDKITEDKTANDKTAKDKIATKQLLVMGQNS